MFEPWRAWAGAWVRLMISGVMQCSRCGYKRRGGKGGNAPRRSRGGERQRAHHDPPREFDLEQIVAGGLCVGERRLGRAAERGGIGTGSGQDLLRRAGAPWVAGTASEGKRRLADFASLDPQAGGGRDDGEGKRVAFADLQIARMR